MNTWTFEGWGYYLRASEYFRIYRNTWGAIRLPGNLEAGDITWRHRNTLGSRGILGEL